MTRQAAIRLALAAGAMLACTTARAAEPPTIDEDVITLVNPHAASSQKADAARRFADRTLDPSETRRAARALTRQSFYDMQPVRDAASESLIRLVGFAQATRMRAEYIVDHQLSDSFAQDWIEATSHWKSAKKIQDLLAPAVRLARRSDRYAIAAIAQAAAKETEAIKNLDESLRKRLIAHLDAYDKVDPSTRAAALQLVEQIGPDTAAAVPLIFRAQAGNDAEIAKAAQRIARVTFEKVAEREDLIAAVAEGLVDPDPKVAAAAAQPAANAPVKALEPCVASAVARAAARDDLRALAILNQRHVSSNAFAAAAYTVLVTAEPSQRLPVLQAIRAAGSDAELEHLEHLRDFVIGLLTQGDDDTRVQAAQLFTPSRTPRARAAAVQSLLDNIANGQSLSPATLKAFDPDPEAFGRKLLPVLQRGMPEALRAALEALAVVGVKEPLRPHLAELLRSSLDSVRHAAAAALDTPEAHALATVPDVLKNLRADDFPTRLRAAIQFRRLATEPPDFTAALVRAVDNRDMPTREGLLLGIERGFATATPATDALKSAATTDPDPTRRLYARAALRELGTK